MKSKIFRICLIIFITFLVMLTFIEVCSAKTTYKVKNDSNYIEIKGSAVSAKVPRGTPKEPSKVANKQNISNNNDYKTYEKLSETKPLFKNWTTIKAYNKINAVGTRLLESSGISENIVFSVQSSRQANAATNLQGEIVLYTGMLKYVETEDELAAVIGHEIGHIINNDVKRSMRRKVLLQLAGVPDVVVSKKERNDEYRADIAGADLLVNAEYNPLAEISILNKVSGHYNDLTATHPTGRKRLNALYSYIKTNYPEYIQQGYNTVSYNRALKIIGVE